MPRQRIAAQRRNAIQKLVFGRRGREIFRKCCRRKQSRTGAAQAAGRGAQPTATDELVGSGARSPLAATLRHLDWRECRQRSAVTLDPPAIEKQLAAFGPRCGEKLAIPRPQSRPFRLALLASRPPRLLSGVGESPSHRPPEGELLRSPPGCEFKRLSCRFRGYF